MDPQAADLASRHLTAACFLLATAASLLAKRFVLATLMAFGSIESYQLWRFVFHEEVEQIMEGLFPGHDHYTLQTGLIIAATGPAIVMVVIYVRMIAQAGWGRRIALTAIYAMLAMLAVELVSRDDIVRYVYVLLGPFAVFTWWIAASALMVAAGCWLEKREAQHCGPGARS